ncbi:MAG: class B sortase [Oscillospiraceae bacterium]|nr:class B sortase [Oscillospiraceae bacterium]
MKKFLLALGVVLTFALLLGAAAYVLLFMEDPVQEGRGESISVAEKVSKPKNADVRDQAETQADILEMLDYETRKNRDTVGWLWVPGTQINNSVLQSYDNTVYLRQDERREYDLYGCYFVDYECSVGSREELSPNTIIYGHSDLKDNPDGPRFSQLYHFTDLDFARETPVIQFSTLDGFMYWEVFAVFYTELNDSFISPDPPEGIDRMAAAAMEKSLYDYGVAVGPQDHVLLLSTCTGSYGANDTSHRFVVLAKLLPEEAEIPTQAQLEVRTES